MSRDITASAHAITVVLRSTLRDASFRRGIVGLSGRVDEIVVAALAAEALSAEQVRLLVLVDPEDETGAAERARAAAEHVGADTEEIGLDPHLDALLRDAPEADPKRRRAFLARLRTNLLHDRSLAHRALVLAATSKTDLLLGRATLYGESAGAVNPIGDLYATEVVALAEHLGIPADVIGPPPVVDLPARSAEGGGFEPSYAWIDPLLKLLVDGRVRRRELTEMGYDRADVQRVASTVRRNRYRRRPPVIPAVSGRPV